MAQWQWTETRAGNLNAAFFCFRFFYMTFPEQFNMSIFQRQTLTRNKKKTNWKKLYYLPNTLENLGVRVLDYWGLLWQCWGAVRRQHLNFHFRAVDQTTFPTLSRAIWKIGKAANVDIALSFKEVISSISIINIIFWYSYSSYIWYNSCIYDFIKYLKGTLL